MSETVLVALLSGGIGSGVVGIVLAVLQRKWAKEDRKKDRMDALVSAQKVLMVDRVRHLGKSYISEKEISVGDKENLQEMYKAYKALGGNGHLDTIMKEIDRLPVIGE